MELSETDFLLMQNCMTLNIKQSELISSTSEVMFLPPRLVCWLVYLSVCQLD